MESPPATGRPPVAPAGSLRQRHATPDASVRAPARRASPGDSVSPGTPASDIVEAYLKRNAPADAGGYLSASGDDEAPRGPWAQRALRAGCRWGLVLLAVWLLDSAGAVFEGWVMRRLADGVPPVS